MSEEPGREGQRDWGGDTAALGGYGSAGLFSRRRQMERTQGGSYQNLSDISRASAPGGYARMPTTGPQPEVTTPFFGKRQGPSGPSAMASGVAGNYNVSPPRVPNWGQTGRLLRGAIGAAALLRGDKSEQPSDGGNDVAEQPWGPPTGDPKHGPINLGEDPFAGPDTDDWGRPLNPGGRRQGPANWPAPTGAPRHGPTRLGEDPFDTPTAGSAARPAGRSAAAAAGATAARTGQAAPAQPAWGAPTGVRFDPDALWADPSELFDPELEDPFQGRGSRVPTEDLFGPDTAVLDPETGLPDPTLEGPSFSRRGPGPRSGGQPVIPVRPNSRSGRPGGPGRSAPGRPGGPGRVAPGRPGGPDSTVRQRREAQQQGVPSGSTPEQMELPLEFQMTLPFGRTSTAEDAPPAPSGPIPGQMELPLTYQMTLPFGNASDPAATQAPAGPTVSQPETPSDTGRRFPNRPGGTGRQVPGRPGGTGRQVPGRPGGPRAVPPRQAAAQQQAVVQQAAKSYEYPSTAQPMGDELGLFDADTETPFGPSAPEPQTAAPSAPTSMWDDLEGEIDRINASSDALDAETALIRARNQAAQQTQNQAANRGARSRSRSRGRRQIPGQQSFDL